MENTAKGSYGAFSTAGKVSAEIFINIRRKDLILNPKNNKGNNKIIVGFLKRNKYYNIDGDEKKDDLKEEDEKNLDESEVEEIEEETDIFEINEEEEKKKAEELKKKKKKKRRDSFSCFHRLNGDAYKFHDMHLNKKKYRSSYSTPNCTKYYPSKALVWRRSPSGPKWETMGSRKPLHEKIFDGAYIGHEDPLKNITKCFINMDKQTMRGDLANTHNLRVNTAKRFIPIDNKNKSIKRLNKLINESLSTGDINRMNSKKDINKKINLQINDKWKTKIEDNNDNIETTPLQTISTLENQKINDITDISNLKKEKSKSIHKIKALTTELTESSPKNTNRINTNINQSKSIISSKIENDFEEKKNIDLSSEKNDYKSHSGIESSELNDSYHKYKNHYTKQIKTHQKNNIQKENLPKLSILNSKRSSININNKSASVKSKISNNIKRPKTSLGDGVRYMEHKVHIRGPEFDKIIPREYYDNLEDNGISLIPFSINNYTQVRERPLTVVIYNRKPFLRKKINHFKGMEIDQYKSAESYIKHKANKAYVPIFSKMTTRPYDGNPLPVFMKGACCRDACNITTDVSLKMNCYADGKIRGNYNGFMPKKSFNKIINLNLMNSNTIIDYLLSNKKEAFKNNDEIIRSLKFYKKYYKEILK